jgi:hypothetical protein
LINTSNSKLNEDQKEFKARLKKGKSILVKEFSKQRIRKMKSGWSRLKLRIGFRKLKFYMVKNIYFKNLMEIKAY